MSTQQNDRRIHLGVIASVILVSLAAIIAAVLIIRKYCFPRSEVSYRYSVLRRMEDQGSAGAEEVAEKVPHTVEAESDEDLLD